MGRGQEDRFLVEILDRNAVHVWCLDTEKLNPDELTSASDLLSSEERGRHRRLQSPEDRRDFAAAHALLRHSLSLYSDVSSRDWRFEVTPNGKPLILQRQNDRQEPLGFSLSHTRGLVACAIGLQPAVGVDVERLDRIVDIESIAPLCLSSSELDGLKRFTGPERQIRFMELWVVKEAFIKATGKDLSDLKAASFSLSEDGRVELASGSIDGRGWHFELFRLTPRYRLGVAVNCSNPKVLCRWTDPRFAAQN
jgi:4'-phosphopantetheinyl transferase